MPTIDLGNVADVQKVELKRKRVKVTKRDGSVHESDEIDVSSDTTDNVIITVFLLSFVLLLISLAVKDLRELIFTGALPGLFAILMAIVGGAEALRIFLK